MAAAGRVDYIKQDLAFAEVLDTVVSANATQGGGGGRASTSTSSMVVAGEKARFSAPADATVSDLPCNIRREGGSSLVIGGPSLVILEGREGHPL